MSLGQDRRRGAASRPDPVDRPVEKLEESPERREQMVGAAVPAGGGQPRGAFAPASKGIGLATSARGRSVRRQLFRALSRERASTLTGKHCLSVAGFVLDRRPGLSRAPVGLSPS